MPRGWRSPCRSIRSCPAVVKGDAGRMRQILLNLGGNAVKFTQRGEVSLALKVLRDRRARHAACAARCATPASAFPPIASTALFTPFTQVDTSTTRRFGGTGLGLSIVRRLVELMGGEIGVDSEAGEGSTFWFTARFAPATGQPRRACSRRPRVKGQRMLVVDDNATNRKVLMGQLMLCGVEPMSVRARRMRRSH